MYDLRSHGGDLVRSFVAGYVLALLSLMASLLVSVAMRRSSSKTSSAVVGGAAVRAARMRRYEASARRVEGGLEEFRRHIERERDDRRRNVGSAENKKGRCVDYDVHVIADYDEVRGGAARIPPQKAVDEYATEAYARTLRAYDVVRRAGLVVDANAVYFGKTTENARVQRFDAHRRRRDVPSHCMVFFVELLVIDDKTAQQYRSGDTGEMFALAVENRLVSLARAAGGPLKVLNRSNGGGGGMSRKLSDDNAGVVYARFCVCDKNT